MLLYSELSKLALFWVKDVYDIMYELSILWLNRLATEDISWPHRAWGKMCSQLSPAGLCTKIIWV